MATRMRTRRARRAKRADALRERRRPMIAALVRAAVERGAR